MWDPWADAACSRASAARRSSPSSYFHLLRNYRRHGWIVLYLFGVSPVVCNSLPARPQRRRCRGSRRTPRTSRTPRRLRMSDLGYRNRNQAGLSVSVNSLDEYVRDLARAITTPHAPYEKLGVKVDGEYRQLNANILQIENEYYSFIRPKRVARSGERPDQGAAARRRRIRRGARARRERVRSGGRQPEQAALPRGVPRVVPHEGFAADRHLRAGHAGRQSRDGRAARPRARPHARARRAQRCRCSTGRASCSIRCSGIAEVLDRGDPAEALCGGARRAGREDRQRGADAVGAHAGASSSPPASRSSTWRCACRGCTRSTSWRCIRPTSSARRSSAPRLMSP